MILSSRGAERADDMRARVVHTVLRRVKKWHCSASTVMTARARDRPWTPLVATSSATVMSEQQPLLQDVEGGENSRPESVSYRERLASWLESPHFHKFVIALVGTNFLTLHWLYY